MEDQTPTSIHHVHAPPNAVYESSDVGKVGEERLADREFAAGGDIEGVGAGDGGDEEGD